MYLAQTALVFNNRLNKKQTFGSSNKDMTSSHQASTQLCYSLFLEHNMSSFVLVSNTQGKTCVFVCICV